MYSDHTQAKEFNYRCIVLDYPLLSHMYKDILNSSRLDFESELA